MRISDWSSDVCSSDLGSVACIERANHRADLTEDCAFLGNGEVTTHLKDIAAADSKTVNAGNHGLLKALDRVVHLQGRSEERRVGKECVRTCRSRGTT